MTVKLNKEEVAARQLDMAIELLFSGRDIVSVHTLAAASSQVFADLIKDKGHKNWRQEMVDCFKDVLRKSENFFKHANRDPAEVIEFDELENDDTIFVAIQEYLELLKLDGNDGLATVPMSVFQMWYIAKRAPELLLPSEIVNEAQSHFPGLAEYPRFHQLSLGATALARERGDRLR